MLQATSLVRWCQYETSCHHGMSVLRRRDQRCFTSSCVVSSEYRCRTTKGRNALLCPVRLQAHVRQHAGDADFFVRGGLAAFVIFQDFVDHVSSPADYDGIGLQVVGKSDQ